MQVLQNLQLRSDFFLSEQVAGLLINVRHFDHEGLCQLQSLYLMKTFMVKTSCICQLLSCYVFARESVALLNCSVTMSLYDIKVAIVMTSNLKLMLDWMWVVQSASS